MKKFNLEKALAGEPVVTRNGEKVTQLITFDCNGHYPLHGVRNRSHHRWTVEGISIIDGKSPYDLFMAEAEMWVNVYYDEESNSGYVSRVFPSEAQAKFKMGLSYHYQTTIKLK